MTTILEFIAEKLLGPPARHCGNGESYWCCPFHDDSHPSFHTLPLKAGCREYFKCWGCGAWGDVYELVKRLVSSDYKDRIQLIESWKREWEVSTSTEGKESGQIAMPSSNGTFSSPMTLRLRKDPASIRVAYKNLTPEERTTIYNAMSIARGKGVDLDALAWLTWHRVRNSKRWRLESRLREIRKSHE